MTEVRHTTYGGVGLFATRDYKVGDVLLEEDPLIILSTDHTKAAAVASSASGGGAKEQDDGDKDTAPEIVVPSTVPSNQEGKFKGMIQAATSYAQQHKNLVDTNVKDKLLSLYYPQKNASSDEEQELAELSKKAMGYLKQNATNDELKHLLSTNPTILERVMMIWSCNSFQGGRIYETQSRINHSCNPNAIVQTTTNHDNAQCIRVAAPIASGEEITISYLGLLLYGDAVTRRHQLQRDKHFTCACERCTSSRDFAAAIPCPFCHARQGRYLEEDVQYDDEQTVHYVIPSSGDETAVTECSHCGNTTTDNDVIRLMQTVSTKVADHLDQQHTPTKDDEEEDDNVQQEWQDQLLQLASSVVGARHWTTNVLLLLKLDSSLQTLHSNIITTGTPPELEEVAECIDSLERIVRFVNFLGLKLHMGHVLSHVVIGIARTLVALGDAKSKRYASEWLDKIKEDYVDVFESDDMRKVVTTLHVAWQKDSPQEQESKDSNKRARVS